MHKAKKYLIKETSDLFESSTQDLFKEFLIPMLELSIAMNTKYDVVCTNPPYHNKYNPALKTFMQKNYPDTKSDMYSAFIEKCFKWTTRNGYSAMMAPFTWMFISTHEKLRKYILREGAISSLVQLEYSAFEDATVPLCTFVLHNQIEDTVGVYIRLSDFKGGMDIQAEKVREAQIRNNVTYRYEKNDKTFNKIPASPIAYWISDKITKIYTTNQVLGEIAYPKTGMTTGDNLKFLRLWPEVNVESCNFSASSSIDALKSQKKWFPYSKGGGFRRWYGYNEYLVNWYKDGYCIKTNIKSDGKKVASVRSENLYFKKLITWSAVTSGNFSCRLIEKGFLFDSGGSSMLAEEDSNYMLSLLNSNVGQFFLNIINTTINYQPGDIARIPTIIDKKMSSEINQIAYNNISISKLDWDSFETSWNFEMHPFITCRNNSTRISDVFSNWDSVSRKHFNQLKENEEELNRIFIDIYGLQDEIIPEVEDKDVTVRKAEVDRDVRSFLSYLVGVIFGRYRLDKPGLAFAGGEFNLDEFGSYKPDKDNIIPITAEHYFEDDIVSKITELVAIIYGKDTLNENLQFIATHLGMKESETAEDTIRRYFMKDFYKDHLKIYQKRPIYWQFSSGKKGAFKGLMYLHRYDKYTLARIRTDYVLKLTTTLNQLIEHAQVIIDGNVSAKEVARARKEREAYEAQLQELREYDLILKQLADQEIDLDLDDGVKVNYAKFQDIPFKKDNGRSDKKNLFEKI